MEKEKFSALGLPDELLEKVCGGFAVESVVTDDGESWLIYHLSPGESCYDNVFLPTYNNWKIDPKGMVYNASFELDAKDRIRSARTLKVKVGAGSGYIGVIEVQY